MRKHIVAIAASLALSQVPNGAFAQQTSPAPWAGWARCQVTVQGSGYSDQQTHTWTIAGGAPTAQGAFQIYPATWSVVGSGSLSRTQGTQTLLAQWATNAPAVDAPIAVFIRASDNRLIIQARHAQLRSAGAIQGFQQQTIDGRVQSPIKMSIEAFEMAFPVITPSARATSATGSSTAAVNGSVGPMQPAGSQATASCTWQFGQGSDAPAPPPALTAQAIPSPGNPATSPPLANNPPTTAPPVSNLPTNTPPANNPPTTTPPTSTPPTTTPPGNSPPGNTVPQAPTGLVAVPLGSGALPMITLTRITLITPNGGESWAAGQQRYVAWTHNLAATQLFDVDASVDGGVTWTALWHDVKPYALAHIAPGAVGTFVVLPRALSTSALVRVSVAGQTQASDVSDDSFNLVTPVIIFQTAVAGERWTIGTKPAPTITWTHNFWPQQSFWPELSRDGGATWMSVGVALNNSFTWYEVTGPATTRARIRVRSTHGGTGQAGGPQSIIAETPNFSIVAP